MICIFSPAGELTGGTYRSLRSMLGFPRGKFRLFMPLDVKLSLLNALKQLINDPLLYSLVASAEELNPIGTCKGKWRCYVNYGKKLIPQLKESKCEVIYVPHEHPYIPLGFGSSVKWAMLLQVTPVVGSLITEEGRGFRLFWKNMKLKYETSPIKILKGYYRLLTYKKLFKIGKVFAVSKSISYELEKLGIGSNVEVLWPGVGVDPCQQKNPPNNRDIDVIFFARLLPEKGIYDFLKVVKILQQQSPRIKAIAIGMADEQNYQRIVTYSKNQNINVNIVHNLKRDEAMRLLGRAKLMIYPSKFDAFPLAVLEALSCGTPVIAYNIPAIRLNFETPAVMKVRPGDIIEMAELALITLSNYYEFADEAIKFASMFTWENVSQTEWSRISSL
ncbi:glycosyltransferase (type 1) [Pyrobaculum aerophilum str. IM2]|uniref:Glycosyltransferase (Type 1) n=3 Tax=Pyrobaculum aerophilum TaxID=13773 RepID=Q8ZYZ0_PYRAE|nr:glycosyltransferase [Pyrobaculum aerophilum]AAL62851.1 glycosyltransferase (type 1) [Pyrobaculum aerophilum str. IM2]HII46276.1 glycosyltransferase [Pyrobaculum aerophilum]